MKIESIIKRKAGSKITLENPCTTYHFVPESDSENAPHVATVTNKSHIKTLLSISEGFKQYGTSTDSDEDEEIVLKGTDWKPEITEYGNGDSVATSALVLQAFEMSGLDEAAWNKLSNKDIKERLLSEIEVLIDNTPAKAESTEETTDATPVLDQAPVVAEVPKTKAEKKAALEARKLALGQV
jgi:hypothetical protein